MGEGKWSGPFRVGGHKHVEQKPGPLIILVVPEPIRYPSKLTLMVMDKEGEAVSLDQFSWVIQNEIRNFGPKVNGNQLTIALDSKYLDTSMSVRHRKEALDNLIRRVADAICGSLRPQRSYKLRGRVELPK